MLRASIEALAVLSLQAGARAAASYVVEQLSEADEQVAIRFTRAARPKGASAAADAGTQHPAGASPGAGPLPPMTALSSPQPSPPQKRAVPSRRDGATSHGSGSERGCRAVPSTSQLPPGSSAAAGSALSLPTRVGAASARASPANYGDAALAAIGMTAGALSSVRSQLQSKARTQAWQEARAALRRLLACGGVVGRWARREQGRGNSQLPSTLGLRRAQPGPGWRSGERSNTRPLAAKPGRRYPPPAAPPDLAYRDKAPDALGPARLESGIELRSSPLLAYLSAKRLAAAQVPLTDIQLRAAALGRSLVALAHAREQPEPSAGARGPAAAAEGKLVMQGANASNVAPPLDPKATARRAEHARGLSASQRYVTLPEHSTDPARRCLAQPQFVQARTQRLVNRSASAASREAAANALASAWGATVTSAGESVIPLGMHPLLAERVAAASGGRP